MSNPSEYPVMIRAVPQGSETGFVALVPDLPGCMSDGETPQEAFSNVQDAIACWLEEARELGLVIPDATPQQPELYRKVG